MKGLLFWGSIALAVGVCYLACKVIEESTDNSNGKDFEPNFFDSTYSGSNLKCDTYSAVVTKEWIINKTQEFFNNASVKKIAVIDLKYIDTFKEKFKNNFSKFVNRGYDYIIVSMNSCGDIIKVDVVKNLFDVDEEVEQLLGEEHMLVINV